MKKRIILIDLAIFVLLGWFVFPVLLYPAVLILAYLLYLFVCVRWWGKTIGSFMVSRDGVYVLLRSALRAWRFCIFACLVNIFALIVFTRSLNSSYGENSDWVRIDWMEAVTQDYVSGLSMMVLAVSMVALIGFAVWFFRRFRETSGTA